MDQEASQAQEGRAPRPGAALLPLKGRHGTLPPTRSNEQQQVRTSAVGGGERHKNLYMAQLSFMNETEQTFSEVKRLRVFSTSKPP